MSCSDIDYEKIAQNVAQPVFTYIIYEYEKSRTKMRATSVIFKKLSLANNRPLGENSPNLVTLIDSYIFMKSVCLHMY
jgi:hypothetical protein